MDKTKRFQKESCLLHLLGVLSFTNVTFFMKVLEGDVSKRELRRLGEQLLIYYFVLY